MYRKIVSVIATFVFFIGFIGVRHAYCFRVPPEEKNPGYLYVFGEDGKKTFGAKKEPLVLFIRIPETYKGKVNVAVYDPDVGGYLDEKSGVWNTKTRFSIFGSKGAYTSIEGLTEAKIKNFTEGVLIESEEFGEDKSYDREFYNFSPIDATAGEKVGQYRYLKIVAEGLSGDDNNVFYLKVLPDTVEVFGYSLSLRLVEHRGAKMAFYPEIPQGTTRIVEYNYDLDSDGGDIELISSSQAYRVKGSSTGMWANTEIEVNSRDTGQRWVYEITKGKQHNANMAMYITTGEGSPIPVFFTPGPGGPKRVFVKKPVAGTHAAATPSKEEPWMESKLSCNTFTFDGSKSYDPDKQELSYFWDFGDGTTSTQIRTMHTYKEAGKYMVKLTVTDTSEAECNTATTQQIIKVNEPPCVIAKGPNLACVEEEIMFDGSQTTDSPGDKLTYRWDFGDGSTKQGIKVAHSYKKGGDYLVTLVVTDDSGSMCDTGVDKINVSVNTPPVAEAGKDILLCQKDPENPLQVTFDASNTRDADGDGLTYVWDFGDGETAEGKVVTHTYEKGGEYVAKLLVTDNTDTDCNKSQDSVLVSLNRSPKAVAGKDMKICLLDTAKFDAGASYDSDGDTLTYSWDFGDGKSAAGKEVSHEFNKGGLYKVRLTVDDNTDTACATSTDIILVDVNSTPIADISADTVACVGKDVKFDAALSSDPDGDRLSYTWDFGDGTTGSGSVVRHSYKEGGAYKATLFVDDGRVSECSGATKVHYIDINTPPVAEAGPDLIVCINNEIKFDGSKSFDADNDKLTFIWDFGDGETAEGIEVSHAYKDIGTYKVALTVKDDSGTECNEAVDTLVATVNAEPVPVIEVL